MEVREMSLGFVRHSWCPAMPSLTRDEHWSLRLEPIIWDYPPSFHMEADFPRISRSFNIDSLLVQYTGHVASSAWPLAMFTILEWRIE